MQLSIKKEIREDAQNLIMTHVAQSLLSAKDAGQTEYFQQVMRKQAIIIAKKLGYDSYPGIF